MKKAFLTIAILLSIFICNGQNQNDSTKVYKPIQLTTDDFLTKIANYHTNPNEWKYLGSKPAIIDFYADWCGPCRIIAPIINELAQEYGDKINIYKVNLDDNTELGNILKITSIPAFLFIPLDGMPQMANGLLPKEAFVNAINEFLLKSQPIE